MKQDEKDTTITFRCSEKLKKSLESMAKKDNRSLSNMLVMLLQKAVDTSKEK